MRCLRGVREKSRTASGAGKRTVFGGRRADDSRSAKAPAPPAAGRRILGILPKIEWPRPRIKTLQTRFGRFAQILSEEAVLADCQKCSPIIAVMVRGVT